LGEDVAGKVLGELDGSEVQALSNQMSVLGNVGMDDMETVNEEF
jgi:flagellar motor switch protein FliG